MQIFKFRFKADLGSREIAELENRLGMIIGDVDDPRKDSPGVGMLGETVTLGLHRTDTAAYWKLIGASHGETPDSQIVKYREQVRSVVDDIAEEWEEV